MFCSVLTDPPGRLGRVRKFDSPEHTLATQYDIVRLDQVDSTQDIAAARSSAANAPVLVVAERQVAGRGRQGRTWVQPDRGMFSSFSLPAPWPIESLTLLPLCVGVSVRRAVRNLAGIEVDLKWPNDLLLSETKLGGILVEVADGTVTAGCGLNVYWAEAPNYATGLLAEDPGPDFATRLAHAWADEFLEIAEGGHTHWPEAEYREACITIGVEVAWSDGSGTAVDLAPSGALVVDTAEGRVEITSGDVHLRSHR